MIHFHLANGKFHSQKYALREKNRPAVPSTQLSRTTGWTVPSPAVCMPWSGEYPCPQVSVNLTHSGQKALLHYNEDAVQINLKCFYTPKCHRDRNDLLSSALDIKAFFSHKNGTAFPCFYSPGSHAEDGILPKMYDQMAILHCFLWPSLTLLGGALIVGMVRLTQHLSLTV
ncbi:Calcium-activated potassium channel subunit beta-3 [Plecturocebus cupreus]